MLKNTPFAVILLFAITSWALPQSATPLDLSGTWKLNLSKSKLKPAKGADIHSETVVIVVVGPNIQFRFTRNGDDYTRTYVTDGKERYWSHLQHDGVGTEVFGKASWKKSVLLTESVFRVAIAGPPGSGAAESSLKERWYLSGDGQTLSGELSAPDDPKQVFVYDKQ